MGVDHLPSNPKTDEEAGVDAANVGRTGYGILRGELQSMYSMDLSNADTFPEGMTQLEMNNWYNYSLRDEYPPLTSQSATENRRMWQEMEVERMLDHHPTHEIHPNDLPNYHYWPMIQNEVGIKPKVETSTTIEHRQDATDVPRFHKTGIPKTPPQEQDFYIPLKQDGRFDWRRNIRENGYAASIFSTRGWDKRFYVPINRPVLPFFHTGTRTFAVLPPHFRHAEIPLTTRLTRHFTSNCIDRHAIFFGIYLSLLLYGSTKSGGYKKLNWDNEAWNFDVHFTMLNRNQGGYHGFI